MAKKDVRENVGLKCSVCNEINHTTSKNKQNTEGKLEIKKFCKRCNKTTLHTERKL
ncbi:MAG: 50S ribosomal protein L33 [Bacilli bacterium]